MKRPLGEVGPITEENVYAPAFYRRLALLGFSPLDNLEIYGVVGGSTLSIDSFDGFDAGTDATFGGGVQWIL